MTNGGGGKVIWQKEVFKFLKYIKYRRTITPIFMQNLQANLQVVYFIWDNKNCFISVKEGNIYVD